MGETQRNGMNSNKAKATDDYGIDQGLNLMRHNYIDDPEILDQFSVECSESLKECSTAIYVYRDRMDIRRSPACGNIEAPNRDSLSFDEIDNIVLKSNGRRLFIRLSGEIRLDFRPGSRYYYLGTPEYAEKKDIRLTEANQILFDYEYNSLVDTHIENMQKILRAYKNEVKSQAKQEKQKPEHVTYQTNSTVNQFGEGTVYNNSYNNSYNTNIDNCIIDLFKEVQSETYGEEREEMLRVLYEVEQLIKEMKQTGKISESRKGKLEKIGDHFKKHEWFYGGIASAIGNAVMKYVLGI